MPSILARDTNVLLACRIVTYAFCDCSIVNGEALLLLPMGISGLNFIVSRVTLLNYLHFLVIKNLLCLIYWLASFISFNSLSMQQRNRYVTILKLLTMLKLMKCLLPKSYGVGKVLNIIRTWIISIKIIRMDYLRKNIKI